MLKLDPRTFLKQGSLYTNRKAVLPIISKQPPKEILLEGVGLFKYDSTDKMPFTGEVYIYTFGEGRKKIFLRFW